jgi:serine/threonine-protein kinase
MTPHEVGTIVTQLAKALAKAHRVGVVHRDLKPENVFLCDVEGGEPFVKLLDFGTAKEEQHAPFATATGQLIGTPHYMSPEQILGEEVDARTDIWSLGVLAFEALTGARPFEGATVGAITLAIHTASPRMTDVVPELPVAFDEWFAQACARAPADRFPDAKTAGDAFARAVTGEPMAADSSPDPVFELAIRDSDRVATSLSSTLSTPRHERKTMTWIASSVFAASVLGMLAFFAHEDSRAATSVAAASATITATATATAPVTAAAPVASAAGRTVAPPVAASTAVSSSAAAPSIAAAPSTAVAAVPSAPRGAPSASSIAAPPSSAARSATATQGRAAAADPSFGPLPSFPVPSAASPFPRPSPADV